MIWFRLNIGRERNADPKWLIPLICEAGGISKSEIGSIKIFDRDTRFEITARIADKFADTVRVNKSKKGAITRVEREGFGARPRSSKPADRGAKKKHRGAASGAKA